MIPLCKPSTTHISKNEETLLKSKTAVLESAIADFKKKILINHCAKWLLKNPDRAGNLSQKTAWNKQVTLLFPRQKSSLLFISTLLSKADTTLLPFRGTARHSCVSAGEQSQRKRYKAITAAPHPDPPSHWSHSKKQPLASLGAYLTTKKTCSYFSKFPGPPFGHRSHLCQKYSTVLLPVIH